MNNRFFILVYSNCDELEMIGYAYFDFLGSVDHAKSPSGYMFKLAGGSIS